MYHAKFLLAERWERRLMFFLEYKQLYIPREALTKNRCFQGFRWKQYAMCETKEPLEKFIAKAKEKEKWRIVKCPLNGWKGK